MRFDRLTAALVVLLGVLSGAGLVLVLGGDRATSRHVVVDGVPMDEFHPASVEQLPTQGRSFRESSREVARQGRPGVVVAHGFAGSADLMAPFGESLAARGYVVVLMDFSGHGANSRRLPDDAAATGASARALSLDLDVAVTHLRGLPDVDPTRTALVGHSMGASAVTRYAVAHPEITATVALSLPDASTVTRDRPARLLVMPGALEFPSFRDQAEKAVAGAGPDRRMLVVPGVEHISILFAPRTHRETADWLDTSLGLPSTEAGFRSPMRSVAGASLLLLALLAGMAPLARLVLGPSSGGRPRVDATMTGRAAAVAAAAAAVGALVAPLLPTERLPIALGGYLTGFAVVAAALMLGYARWRGPRRTTAPTTIARSITAPPPPTRRRVIVGALVLPAYAALTIVAPLQLGLTHAVPTGARWWLLAVVWAGFALLAYAGLRLTDDDAVAALIVSALCPIALAGAAIGGLTSTFLVLILPLLAVLLLWQSIWTEILRRCGAPRWLVAPVGSLIVAWPLAVALPLVHHG
ncbi:alpha/beta fold hydrolase [Actinoplanes sp. NPDC051633]|uniref:dienelactone hydrolase family protein n=1 Tax=Actinoplanes sp. NPDC051633 TaxID=3155670 RepID=UPI00343F14DB